MKNFYEYIMIVIENIKKFIATITRHDHHNNKSLTIINLSIIINLFEDIHKSHDIH